MDTLLTWSGEASHEIASFFHTWLPLVLPGIQPWISDEDIAKGKQWFPQLMSQLSRSNISITFITPENVRSPWIYYEVGVIAAKLENGFVCPYLVGVDTRMVKDTPLGQFQWTEAGKADSWKLIRSINQYLGDKQHDERLLKGNFDNQWSKLKRQIDKIVEVLGEVQEEVTETAPSVEERLSLEARQLLLEAAQDQHGRIISVQTTGGTTIQTGGRNMIDEQTPRTLAIWRSALEELVNLGLVKAIGYKGEVYEVTRKGFEVADLIKRRSR
jgi:hypothetical protein